MIHGYTTAFWWVSGNFAVGLITALVVFPGRIKDETVGGQVSLATEQQPGFRRHAPRIGATSFMWQLFGTFPTRAEFVLPRHNGLDAGSAVAARVNWGYGATTPVPEPT